MKKILIAGVSCIAVAVIAAAVAHAAPPSPGTTMKQVTIKAKPGLAAGALLANVIDRHFSQNVADYSAAFLPYTSPKGKTVGRLTLRGALGDPCLGWQDLPVNNVNVTYADPDANSWQTKTLWNSKVVVVAHLACNPPQQNGKDLYDCGTHNVDMVQPVYGECKPEPEAVGGFARNFRCDVDLNDLFLKSGIFYWYNTKTPKELLDLLNSDQFKLRISFVTGIATGGDVTAMAQSPLITVKDVVVEGALNAFTPTSATACPQASAQTPARFASSTDSYMTRVVYYSLQEQGDLDKKPTEAKAIQFEGAMAGSMNFDDLIPNSQGQRVVIWYERPGGSGPLPTTCEGNKYWLDQFTCTVDAQAVAQALGRTVEEVTKAFETHADLMDGSPIRFTFRTGSQGSCGLCQTKPMGIAEMKGVEANTNNVYNPGSQQKFPVQKKVPLQPSN